MYARLAGGLQFNYDKYHTALKYLWPHTMDLLQLQNIDIEQAAQISTATAEYHAATALRTLPSSSSK